MEYYRILLKKSVSKDLKKIDSSQIPRIIEAIKELAVNPFSSNARKLRSTENFYRLRVGDYRVVYQIDFKDKTIIVHYIRHRRSAY